MHINTNTDHATQLRQLARGYSELHDRVEHLEDQVGPEATEAADELADETGVDLRDVQGTGEGGRVLVGDVRGYLDAQEEAEEAEEDSGEEEG